MVHIQVLPIMSGVQKAMTELLIRLDKKDFEIYVICQAEGELTDFLIKHNVQCFLLPELKREINLYYDFKAFWEIYKLCRRYKFDIVHTHSSKPGFLGRCAAKIAGVQGIIHTVHGFAFHQFSSRKSILFYRLLERLAGFVTSRLILLNELDYKFVLKHRLVKENRAIKIYNGIDFEALNFKINVNRKKHSFKIPKNHKIVGSVGRLWKQKAPQIFIKAIPKVLQQVPDTTFLLIGNGP